MIDIIADLTTSIVGEFLGGLILVLVLNKVESKSK